MASTQVARETILADKPATVTSKDLSRFDQKKPTVTMDGRPPSMLLGKSKETSDVTMGATLNASTTAPDKHSKAKEESTGGESKSHLTKGSEKTPTKAEPQKAELEQNPETPKRPTTSSGWFGVWGGKLTTAEQPKVEDGSSGASKKSNQPLATEQRAADPPKEAAVKPVIPDTASEATPAPPVTTSWFGLWSTSAPSSTEVPKEQMPIKLADANKDTVMQDVIVDKANARPAPGSSWAFWSTETTKEPADLPRNIQDTGQLAIAGEDSQNDPEPARTATLKDGRKGKSAKRGRPLSMELDAATKESATESSKRAVHSESVSSKGTPSQSPAPLSKSPLPNLLMPSVKSTYRLVENPSILQQIARLILHGQQQTNNHVFLIKEPPKIKKALAVGIHGLFPAPLLRTVIGQPTGTSIRFANHAAAAIRRWGDQHGCVDCEIEKVALEGEGKIAERVDNLWKLLLNWIDHVRKADFILVACHSQGVPVAVMLVAKLIEFGVVSIGRIGICAMGTYSTDFVDSVLY